MGKKHILINRFYRSDAWKLARSIKFASVSGLCEKCGAVGEEVHHVIHLTPENVSDVSISIAQDNLELLCKDCHNKVHGRFSKDVIFDADGNPISRQKKSKKSF